MPINPTSAADLSSTSTEGEALPSTDNLDSTEAELRNIIQALLSNEHPEKAQDLFYFAEQLRNKYDRLGNVEDLKAAFLYGQTAVKITPRDHPHLPYYLTSLYLMHKAKFQNLGSTEDLELALNHSRETVVLTAENDPERPRRLTDLAMLHDLRFRRFRDIEDLNIALEKQKAATMCAPSSGESAPRLHMLAALLGDRYQLFGDLDDLQQCLETCRAAIKATPDGDTLLAARHHNLAVAFGDRYERIGDLQDLEGALENFGVAVSLRHTGGREIPKDLHGLAISFRERYHRLQDIKDLEHAVDKAQLAVQLTPEGHPGLPNLLENLAACLQDRYGRLRDLKDLNACLRISKQSLQLTPKDHPQLAAHFHTVGLSLGHRYARLEESNDLESALEHLKKSVDLTLEKSSSLPARLKSYAEILLLRYDKPGNSGDLDSALGNLQIAVSKTPSDHPDLPGRLQALGSCLKTKYMTTGDVQDLEAALVNYRQSFQTQAIKPILSWDTALEWASLAQENQRPECLTAYKYAFSLLPEILWVGSTLSVHQYVTEKTDISNATSDAISACIDYSNLSLAIEILEQGLATRFQQMFQLKGNTDDLPEAYRDRFQELSSQLYSGMAEDPAKIATERNILLGKIRNCPGFENFLQAKSYNEISQACVNGPVIILNANARHCDAIILLRPASDPVHIQLGNVTLHELKRQKEILHNLLQKCNVRSRTMDASRLFGSREVFTSKSNQECFTEILDWLWTHVVHRIFQALESRHFTQGRIWWCLTGAFVGLPLHAASQSDQFIQSYTSTLSSLTEGNRKVLARSSSPPKVGIVGVTHSSKHRAAALPGVAKEIETITSIIDDPTLQSLVGEEATVKAVKEHLQHCSWVHLACHGKQDLADPPKSHLQLYEGILELQTILQMSLPSAEFVYLAACQTAMGDAQLVNESFHLGGGFIAAGFRGAVGTLWAMRDADGPVVAGTVYGHLFGKGGGIPQVIDVARALQLAVRKMRDAGIPYERWVPFIHMGV
ncbi:CHAT domain-containing protein [Mycena vulgaris]|nr:CHAT domain-containing protein [Mycena vulgaris]